MADHLFYTLETSKEQPIMIIKRNWCDAHPTIAHQSGVDWRLLSSAIKTRGDIEEPELEPQYRCLRAITCVSFGKLQSRLTTEHYWRSIRR
jgi:hypothetical protein